MVDKNQSQAVSSTAKGKIALNRIDLVKQVTEEYLSQIPKYSAFDPETVSLDLLERYRDAIDVANVSIAKGQRIKYFDGMPHYGIAMVLNHFYHIVCISYGDSVDENMPVCVYQTKQPYDGIYMDNFVIWLKLICQFNISYSANTDVTKVKNLLRSIVDVVHPTADPDLVPVLNGVFQYKTKTLMDFSPDYVFTSKCMVAYRDKPVLPKITMPDGLIWNVDSWMNDLSDDPGVPELLWEVLGSVVRPYVKFDKAIMLYSERGNNGKGSFCELARALVGESMCCNIPIADFGKDFYLEGLFGSQAVITDENDVGSFSEHMGNFKAAITSDVIQLNRKFQKIITFRYYGRIIECINELPKMKDRSDSVYRRMLFIFFTKCFTGVERKYIKQDYLHRQDVLEYVLWKVLTQIPDYYEYSEPEACKQLLDTYKIWNDPVRDFWETFREEFVWDLLPFDFLYELYKSWMDRNNPRGTTLSKRMFVKQLNMIVDNDDIWEYLNTPVKSKNRMTGSEHLIYEYDLVNWKNPYYHESDIDKICIPVLKDLYRGFTRK